jgi:hypothetical protein
MPGELEIQQATQRAEAILLDLAQAIQDEIRVLVASLDTEEGQLQSTAYNLRAIEDVRRQVRQIAIDQGQTAIADFLDTELPQVIQASLAEAGLGEFAPQITDDVLDFLDGLEEEVIKSLDDTTGDLARAIRRGIVGGSQTSELLQSVARSLDTTLGRAATAIEGGIRRFNERVTLETAKDLGFFYVYIGPVWPNDSKVRPYCRPRAGKVLTQEQADAAAANVDGRWNCRHDLAPITLDEARRQGLEFFNGKA